MDQVLRIMDTTEMRVAFVGGTSTFVVAFLLLWRQQVTIPVPSIWQWQWQGGLQLKLVDKTMAIAVEKERFDCIVCLCEVDEYRNLPNCDHGVQFHAHCINTWLKHHSSCPMCRAHVPRPLFRCLHTYISQQLLQDVIHYCNSTLDNVATSIGDSRDF
ncbi:hypothetical protein L6452_07891 [Arctium lappa]|uniref:Uncharacterized protein n=1 Tax=Arctium lappa TaxID=4217 RepID=A0ACB9ELM1_ARCLA|nr:hypothetical protein L6452_07891 [Arctium lappa]